MRKWIAEWINEGREPHLFMQQPENLESPALARMIHAEVVARIDGLAPLPSPLPRRPRPSGRTRCF